MKFLLIAMTCLLADLTGGGLIDCDEDRLGWAHLPDLSALCTQERDTSQKETSSNQRQAITFSGSLKRQDRSGILAT